jgi:hypothetical protein
MIKRRDVVDNGSWAYAEELYERGDPLFVSELRRITDAERLGNFAARWYGDRRPQARQLLIDYLDKPLNAFRHEAIVKRLFKLAEKAADHEVMGCFLVMFDRSIRRRRQNLSRYVHETTATKEEAEAIRTRWLAENRGQVTVSPAWQNRYFVSCHWTEDALRLPHSTVMWRPAEAQRRGPHPIADSAREQFEQHRLYSVATRRYLQRRAWRYFRKLGKEQPERYVPAVTAALRRYRDEDVSDGLALIDNWGLTHILFHDSPVLQSLKSGWTLAPGKALRELSPAPKYENLWHGAPGSLLDLLKHAQCRPIRQWALFMIRRDHAAVLQSLSPDDLFELLASDDPVIVDMAAEILRDHPNVAGLGVDRLLGLLATPHPDTVVPLCSFLEARLGAEHVTFAQAVQLAGSRPVPAARLGFSWLKAKTPTNEEEFRMLLGLADAKAEQLRPELVHWARSVLSESPGFQPPWVLEFIDSRHPEVRAEGWQWLQADPRLRENTEIWQKLLESPYDDIRLLLVRELEKQVAGRSPPAKGDGVDDDLVRFLWASVLLNIHRGGRVKPLVIGQLVERVTSHPAEADRLLPILAVALRSLRGPEWRAGLAGVVKLVERNADLQPLVEKMFPELKLN